MKPIIGIAGDFTTNDEIGRTLHIGVRGQSYQILSTDYLSFLGNSGALPLMIPVFNNGRFHQDYLEMIDGIVFPGGTDIDPVHYRETPAPQSGLPVPERDVQELALFNYVMDHTSLPIFGICRGLQLANVARGGTLYQDIPSQRVESLTHDPKNVFKDALVHKVSLDPDSMLARWIGTDALEVNSFHHQAVKKLSPDFRVVGTAPDGIIEAMESISRPNVFLVQWHPEMLASTYPAQQKIMDGFLSLCAK
ncbi:gamma-glutamyl-gamma-aminobutyrate hydrolase family protein [Peptoniphilaceae bacterium SGI.137]